MVGWGVAGGVGWLGKGGRLEYQRGTNHGGRGALADGEPRAQYGQTPLHLAADRGSEAVVGALLVAGADTDAKGEVIGGGGCKASRGQIRCGSYLFRLCRFEQLYLFRLCRFERLCVSFRGIISSRSVL